MQNSAAASAGTGLDDFGDRHFLIGLSTLVDDLPVHAKQPRPMRCCAQRAVASLPWTDRRSNTESASRRTTRAR